MITVVVPTLWNYLPFLDFLSNLVKVNVVNEVIVINNNVTATPVHLVLNHPKVKLINCQENIYVNPAWNLGVSLSKTNNVCIANDDIIFDLGVLYKLDYFLNSAIGVVGLCPGRKEFNQPPITNGQIDFVPWRGEHTFGFGSLFAIHKKNWNPVPEEMKIYYGDNWAFDTQLRMGRNNWLITNCISYSPWAASTSKINASKWMARETPLYEFFIRGINEGHIVLN